jgi:hypothetical protein
VAGGGGSGGARCENGQEYEQRTGRVHEHVLQNGQGTGGGQEEGGAFEGRGGGCF